MTNNYKARNVAVVVKIGTMQVPVTSVTLHHTINTLPYAEVMVALDNQPSASGVAAIGGVQINIKTISKLGQVLQEKFYNTFALDPDVSITINDANVPDSAPPGTTVVNNPNQLEFRGFLSNPSVVVRNGQFLLAFTALHYMIQLQAFNPQLYFATEYYGVNQDPVPNFYGSTPRDDSITNRTRVVIDGLMAVYQKNWLSVPDPKTEKTAFNTEQAFPTLYEPAQWNMHVLNQAVLPAVHQVLAYSAELTKINGLSVDGQPNQDFSETELNTTLLSILAGSPDMLSAITTLAQPFVFQLNADWYSNIWLEHLQTMEPPQSMIVVPFDTIAYNLAAQFEVPLLQVIVRGPGSDFYAGSPMSSESTVAPMFPNIVPPDGSNFSSISDLYDQSGRILGRYPGIIPRNADGTPVPGRYLYVDAPGWISKDAQNLTAAAFDIKPATVDALNNWQDTMKTAQKNFAAVGQSRVSFLNYLAEYVFKDTFLQRTTARCAGPLFLRPQVGRTYFVRAAAQDETIFIGFLNSVTHTITVDVDGGTATTDYTFSHVRARYAQLTPVSLGNQDNGISDAATMGNLAATENQLEALQEQGLIYRQYTTFELADAAAKQRQQERALLSGLVVDPLNP